MAFSDGDRVFIRPLGLLGTITRVRDDGRYAVRADGAAQDVVWAGNELAPPNDDPLAYAGEHVTSPGMAALLDEVRAGRERRAGQRSIRYRPHDNEQETQ